MVGVSMLCVEGYGKASRKQPVTLCGGLLPAINLHSEKRIPVGTLVRIYWEKHRAKGIVQGCRSRNSDCIVTVEIKGGDQWVLDRLSDSRGHDPGALLVNQFITEAQLSQLMRKHESRARSAN